MRILEWIGPAALLVVIIDGTGLPECYNSDFLFTKRSTSDHPPERPLAIAPPTQA